ncbi:MAG: TIGR00282 family metallophosphoesterase [Fibrobacteres bacterium]|nr:TIGR00282 family metallophosphoesterase [Fibrobacterota bacterium]
MNILFVADIFASGGKRVLSEVLPKLVDEYSIDLVVANGENIAGGRGVTKNLLSKLKKFGVHVVTSGNHIWDNKDGQDCLVSDPHLLRPLNYPVGNPGKGSVVYHLADGRTAAVLNLQGRTFMYSIECPFKTGLSEIQRLKQQTDIILVDFHAEATSEKMALAHYFDGKVSAVVGTHTHIQTADERILPGGTAYITDLGMTGPHDSVIGMKKEPVIRKFLYEIPVRFEPAEDDLQFNGCFVEVDDTTGKALRIERVVRKYQGTGEKDGD